MPRPSSQRAASAPRERLVHACERLMPSDGPRWDLGFDLASAVVGAIVLLLIAMTFGDYGITWDETWHLNYGRHVIHWYASFFADDAALSYRADYLYGGSFDGLGYLARQISPFDKYATIHLFGASVACFGLLGAWKFGRLLGGPAAGFATLVLLVLTPVWYGHMFNNPKDMPFAVGYVWALYYEVRILISMPAVPRSEWAKASFALGVAMSVRIAGLLTLCYLFMIVGLWILWRAREARDARLIPRYLLRFSPQLLGTTLGAWALMLILWPWAQLHPIRRPLIALARMSAFNLHERGMPFGSRRISTLSPPADYLLRYFTFKLPELIIVLVVAALGVFIVRAVRLRKRTKLARLGQVPADLSPVDRDERRRVALGGFLVFAILFPPLYTIAKRSPLYDGLRHFLFLVPIFAVVAGVTLTKGVRLLAARSRAGAWGVNVLVVAYCVRMVLAMVHLHPHEYLFFNSFIGRLPGAYLKYSTDYYGNTYKEGFETLREHLWRTERERYLKGPYVVDACMPDFIAREYLGSNFVLKRSGGPPAEFWLGYTRNNCYLKHKESPELTRVEREDTLLVLIRDLRSDEQRDEVSTRQRPASKPSQRGKPVNKNKARKPGLEHTQGSRAKPTDKAKPESKAAKAKAKPEAAKPKAAKPKAAKPKAEGSR
ncbi:hypothetical protein ENSA5_17990 [Enhygromyxa salina]|uniref:Glycosyltransferase RgtA/B/C/D-like domain-containing protein n=1 Tax=Enhygromyxa salina TaxID=215803 RepID=A0A2S9YD80_9BACT|nr:hypothetical protein [Enhygromyxa salina]PRQ03080.1 hypothetical protein ENSA5_17990 [Enhygromyxa salina]